MEEQMSSIEIFLSKLTNEIDTLKDQKAGIQEKISKLKDKNTHFVEEKEEFQEGKKKKIEAIKARIVELNEDIEKKRAFFMQLKGPTDDFLLTLEGTYLAEYLPNKVAISKDTQYNESNITEIIGYYLKSKCARLPEVDWRNRQNSFGFWNRIRCGSQQGTGSYKQGLRDYINRKTSWRTSRKRTTWIVTSIPALKEKFAQQTICSTKASRRCQKSLLS